MKPKPGSSSQTTGLISHHTDHISTDMKKLSHFQSTAFGSSQETHLWMCPCECFQSALTLVERPTLTTDGDILQAGVPPNKRVKSRQHDEHGTHLCRS